MTKQEFLEYCLNTYGTPPDYPFDDWMESVVFRHAINKKWYAIVLRVSRRKFGFDSDEVPHLVMTGAYRGFSRAAVPEWGFRRGTTGGLRETLFRSQGSQVSMRMAMGSGSLLSSHGRGIGLQDAPKDSQGLSRVAAGNPGFPGLEPVTSGTFSRCL